MIKLVNSLLVISLGVSLCCLPHFGIAEPSPISKTKIGVILPLSGPFARYGSRIQEAITKFKSDNLDFVFEDEGCDPKVALTAFRKLAELDAIKYFLGPWCGSPQTTVAPMLKTGDRLAVLGSSAPQEVFNLSGSRMLSTQHSIEAESTYLAQKINSFGAKSVLIIFRENQFSRAHEAAFRKAYAGKVIDTLAYNSDDVSELKSIALKVKQTNPDALYVPDAFPLMGGLMKELAAIGITNKKVYSVYSIQSEDVLMAVGREGEGIVYSYPDIDDEALDRFPTLAAKILTAAVKKCGNDVACARKELWEQNSFDAHGVLAGNLTLKTIRHGKFERL